MALRKRASGLICLLLVTAAAMLLAGRPTSARPIPPAQEEQDTAQAYTAAHTLKGVAGNLAMTALFRQVSAITEDLRAEDLTAARSKMEELEAQYCQVVSALTAKE